MLSKKFLLGCAILVLQGVQPVHRSGKEKIDTHDLVVIKRTDGTYRYALKGLAHYKKKGINYNGNYFIVGYDDKDRRLIRKSANYLLISFNILCDLLAEKNNQKLF